MKVLILASGTGGHLFPAQQLAFDLQEKGCSIFFAGYQLNKKPFFEKKSFPFYEIPSSPLKKNVIFFFFKILRGFFKSLKMLFKEKPDVVISFGSFHTFPPLIAAKCLRKKIIIFEPNVVLGKVNRIFSKKSTVCTQFPIGFHTVKPLPWRVRDEKIDGNLDPKVFTFLIFGGSQGALFLNDLFLKSIPYLKKMFSFQVIHITGLHADPQKIKKHYQNIKSYVVSFVKNMTPFYKISDLAVCRAGSSTIAELIHFGIPSVLIPYPYASEDHQLKNALFLQDQVGGGVVIEQKNVTVEIFVENIQKVIENKQALKKALRKTKEKSENHKSLADLVLLSSCKQNTY